MSQPRCCRSFGFGIFLKKRRKKHFLLEIYCSESADSRRCEVAIKCLFVAKKDFFSLLQKKDLGQTSFSATSYIKKKKYV